MVFPVLSSQLVGGLDHECYDFPYTYTYLYIYIYILGISSSQLKNSYFSEG